MASGGGVTISPPTPQPYFCHQCNRTVTLTPPPSPNSDLSCPSCNGGFLEEYDPSSPPFIPNPNPNLFFSSPSSSSLPLPPPSFLFSPSPSSFNPLDFVQSYLVDMARSGNVQFVVDNNPNLGLPLPSNLGDYFLGPGLEQLMQQLAENDPNRYGPPPASKKAIEGLPDVVVDTKVLESEFNSCAVCMNEFELRSTVKQMPCKHLYHDKCLRPWLELHNSCPVCRFELPTDDPDYERRRAGRGNMGSEGSESGGGGGSGERRGVVERRFRISLPWPLSGLVPSGGSGSGNDGGSGSNNNNDSSSGGQQSDSHGSESMDLD